MVPTHKFTKPTLIKLENIIKDNGYIIRYEKGNFNSGYCVVEDKNIIVISKFFDVEARVAVLIDLFSQIKIDETLLDDKSKTLIKQVAKAVYNSPKQE